MPISAAVPKSWMTMSRQIAPIGISVGTNPRQNFSILLFARVSHHARKITTAHFASSDG
jgi:hypothetical protein